MVYQRTVYVAKTLIIILLFSLSVFANPSLIPQENAELAFTKSNQTLGNARTFGLAIADIDLDNDNDVFISNYNGASKLWLNDGNGVFSASAQSFNTSEVHDADMSDLNGDSYPDIFLVSHVTPGKVYFNTGTGFFIDSGQNIGSANDAPQTIQLEDIDGDGDTDALIYNLNGPNRIWLNNGEGIFTMMTIDYGGSDSNGLKLADFNGDSFPDLLICLRTQQNQLWINDGHGNFSNSGQELGGDVNDTTINDIDGDGDNDIISVGNNISIWLNQNNTGVFEVGENIEQAALECCLLDADSDGDFELITSHIVNGNLLWLNDGSGSFTSVGAIFGNARVLSIECGDLDGDNDYDVVFGQLEGTGGNSIYFNETTQTVTDYDGNIYKTIKISNQIWMTENLRSTHYSDGTPIQNFVYNNDTTNVRTYGRLYRWAAAMRNASSSNLNPSQVQGASPEGWHIPSDAEWQELINYLGGESVAGGKLKETGFLHWNSANTGATNESGFNALPTGWFDFTGNFMGIGDGCFFRTATAPNSYAAYCRELRNSNASITKVNLHPNDATPIRCVKNAESTKVENLNKEIPAKFVLLKNYPNPFNSSTQIEFTLTKPSNVSLKIFDITGRNIKALLNKHISTGTHTIAWNGKDNFNRNVSTGVYFYQITSSSFSETKKMIFLK